jgi:exodeoxyribonuclease VIII
MKLVRPIGLILDMSFEDYLAVDAFSNSDMKLLARSPWHLKNRVPVIETRPMLRGTLAHCAVLEPDAMASRYVVVPEDAPRRPTKAQWNAKKPSAESAAAMDWWSIFNIDAANREIVAANEYAITQAQLAALQADPEIAALLATGYSECSVFWIDKATGIYCKARPDHVHPIDGSCVKLLDLKSTADDTPSGFGRTVAKLGYHRQQAHYAAGFTTATGLAVEEFVFAAVSSTPPVLAVPYLLPEDFAQQGRDEVRELLELYAHCRKTDTWPSYGTGSGYQLADIPAYANRSNEIEVSDVL